MSVLMLVSFAGCAPKPQPLLRVTVLYPGADASDVETDLAQPMESMLAASPDINSITSICSAGKLEAYINVDRDAVPQEVVHRVATSLDSLHTLPASAQQPVVEVLPQSTTIPDAQPKLIDAIVLDMKPGAAAEHGVTEYELATVLQAADVEDVSADERLQQLRQLRVRTSDNAEVPLTELCELRIEKSPDKIVRTWP
ncbi:hypothetical protein [Roseimaritima ulvae]|nr:hypothetical protein [Roseimaritima ulvae]